EPKAVRTRAPAGPHANPFQRMPAGTRPAPGSFNPGGGDGVCAAKQPGPVGSAHSLVATARPGETPPYPPATRSRVGPATDSVGSLTFGVRGWRRSGSCCLLQLAPGLAVPG